MGLLRVLLVVAAWVLNFWICVQIQALGILSLYLNAFDANDKRTKSPKAEARNTTRTVGLDQIVAKFCLCPEILEVIFKNADIGRLKKFRLVCKAWNHEIYRSMARGRWVASVSDDNDLWQLKEMIESRVNAQLPLPFDTIDMMAQRRIAPGSYLWLRAYDFKITKLRLVEFAPNVSGGVSFDSADFLLQTCCGTLTHLIIHYWVSEIKEPLLFPQLKLLEVWYGSPPQGFWQGPTLFFRKIISAAPKLKRLYIDGKAPGTDILEGAPLSFLEQLDFSAGRTAHFAGLPPGLESVNNLGISLYNIGPEITDGIKQALYPYSSRLKILKHFGLHFWTNPSEYITLPLLTTLQLNHTNPGLIDFTCFPNLKHFIVQQSVVDSGTSSSFRSLSVQTVSLKDSDLSDESHSSTERDTTHELESALATLFLIFPNAQNWDIPYENAVSFCRASLCSGFRVKSLVLRSSHRDFYDEEKLVHDDRFVFSYLERLQDLDTLGLWNECGNRSEGDIRLQGLDFKKMPNLKTLMIRPSLGNKVKQFQNLKGEPRVIIFGRNTLNGEEEILSVENIEYRTGGSLTYHHEHCFWIPVWPLHFYLDKPSSGN